MGKKAIPLKLVWRAGTRWGGEPLRKSKEAQHVGEAKVQGKPREVTFS